MLTLFSSWISFCLLLFFLLSHFSPPFLFEPFTPSCPPPPFPRGKTLGGPGVKQIKVVSKRRFWQGCGRRSELQSTWEPWNFKFFRQHIKSGLFACFSLSFPFLPPHPPRSKLGGEGGKNERRRWKCNNNAISFVSPTKISESLNIRKPNPNFLNFLRRRFFWKWKSPFSQLLLLSEVKNLGGWRGEAKREVWTKWKVTLSKMFDLVFKVNFFFPTHRSPKVNLGGEGGGEGWKGNKKTNEKFEKQ